MSAGGLKAEDGAEFFGRIEFIDEGKFRASCFARIDRKQNVSTEEPKTRMFTTKVLNAYSLRSLAAQDRSLAHAAIPSSFSPLATIRRAS